MVRDIFKIFPLEYILTLSYYEIWCYVLDFREQININRYLKNPPYDESFKQVKPYKQIFKLDTE